MVVLVMEMIKIMVMMWWWWCLKEKQLWSRTSDTVDIQQPPKTFLTFSSDSEKWCRPALWSTFYIAVLRRPTNFCIIVRIHGSFLAYRHRSLRYECSCWRPMDGWKAMYKAVYNEEMLIRFWMNCYLLWVNCFGRRILNELRCLVPSSPGGVWAVVYPVCSGMR